MAQNENTVETTPRSQRIINRLEQAAETIKPFSTAEQNVIKVYFDYLFYGIIPQKNTDSLTQRMQDLVNALEPLCELAPFSESEKSTIKLYADHFGYTYTPTTATPTTKAPENTATITANNTKKPNYKTIAAVAITVVVAIIAFFIFRKK